MTETREKFATHVDPDVLAEIRRLAHQDGRQLQGLVQEALTDLIEKLTNARPRAHVMAAYRLSHERYGALYRKLAR